MEYIVGFSMLIGIIGVCYSKYKEKTSKPKKVEVFGKGFINSSVARRK